jgi:hypothetical protein
MQVSSVAAAPPVSSGAGVVDEIKRLASILADGSGASDDQKVDAYIAIRKSFNSSGRAGWFQSSTQADRDSVNASLNTSDMSKRIMQAADGFSARGMRASRETNVMASQIEALSGMSALQQKMVFAGTASLEQTDTLESWKGFLQENADGRERQMAAERKDAERQTPATRVTLSDDAKAALDDGAKALATLTNEERPGDIATAALGMLKDAAEKLGAAKDQADKDRAAGAIVDKTA